MKIDILYLMSGIPAALFWSIFLPIVGLTQSADASDVAWQQQNTARDRCY